MAAMIYIYIRHEIYKCETQLWVIYTLVVKQTHITDKLDDFIFHIFKLYLLR